MDGWRHPETNAHPERPRWVVSAALMLATVLGCGGIAAAEDDLNVIDPASAAGELAPIDIVGTSPPVRVAGRRPRSGIIDLRDRADSEATYIAQLRSRLGLDANHELVRVSEASSVIPSDRIVRYRHAYRGIEVLDAGLTLRIRQDRVLSHHLSLRPDFDLSLVPARTPEEARAAAEASYHAMSGTRRGEVAFHASSGCRLGLLAYDESRNSSPRLLYRCRLAAPIAAYAIDVDAATGEVFNAASLRLDAWQATTATGDTLHHGTVGPFSAEVDDNGKYRLYARDDETAAVTQKTLNLKGGGAKGKYDAAIDFTTDSLPFDGENAPGVSVHWAAERARNHYEERFGRDPLGGTTQVLYSYVNVGERGAEYDPLSGAIVFGQVDTDWVAFDVAAHEVTHFMVDNLPPFEKGLSRSEHGALHESFADILAQLAEEAALGSTDWIVAAELPESVGAHRNLLDPLQSKVSYDDGNSPLQPQPDVYLGPYWTNFTPPPNEGNDWGGIHVNNGVPNRWFTLLALGGAGTNSANVSFDVTAVGTHAAAQILYMYMEWLEPDDGFLQALKASEKAAIDLCGEMSQARISVIDAWHAVGVAPAPVPSGPYALPFDGQIGVSPWPVRLSWQSHVSIDEPSWLVQISTDPNFPQDGTTQTAQAIHREIENGIEVGFYEGFVLQPASTYYWRVRSTGIVDPEAGCWRPLMSFTTADQIPIATAPNTFGSYHPWALPFQLSAPEGTQGIDIEVARDNAFTDPVFPIKSFSPDADVDDRRWTLRLHVPKAQEALFWRARAVHDIGGISEWSQPLEFATVDPKVVNVAPANGSAVYPWNVPFSWIPLPGAESYSLYSEPLGDGGDHGVGKAAIVHSSGYLSFTAAKLTTNQQYQWTVEATGPPLGSDLQPEAPETRERSQKSDPWTIGIDGDDTAVKMIHPIYDPPPYWCHPPGQAVSVQWHPVAETSNYILRITPIHVADFNQTPPFEHSPAAEVHSEVVPGVQHAWSVPFGNIASINMPSTDKPHVGFRVEMRAVGPKGRLGLIMDNPGRYFLMPTKPIPKDPDTANVNWTMNVRMLWETDFAPGGKYLVQIYDGAACSGTPIFTDEIEHTHFGGAAYNVDLGQKTHGYRVRPNYGYHCPHAYQLWSDCMVTGSWNASPPDRPSVIPGFYGAIGKLLAVFSREQNAEWYEMEVSQDTTNNVIKPFGTLVWNNATLLNHQVQIDNDLCNNYGVCGGLLPYGGTHWFVVIGGTQALTHYFYRVKACNAADCSPPSAYSEWNEGIPWNWW